MEKQKIDRFIDAFRNAMYHEFKVEEEGMVANAAGAQGGFGGSSAPQGPTAVSYTHLTLPTILLV